MWWSWRRYGFWLVKNLTKLDTFDDYLSNFDNASSAFASHLLDASDIHRQPHPYVTGDGTPMDFWDFSGWPLIPQNKGLQDPKILTPHLINHVNPNAKFVLIFREPAERLYSDYLFLGLGKPSPKAFHRKVEKSIVMFQRCKRKLSLRLCSFSRELHVTMPVRLYIGMYSTYLIEWLKVFPIQQFMFIRNEDYSKNINGTLEETFRFLDLEPLSNKTLEQIASSRRVHKTETKQKAGKMETRTRKLLKDFYAPFNRQLTAIVNDLRFLWKDVK
ncbi:hypothetical protein FSP39_000064 [Pinctada imbricata]|uniref:Sulfotransferase domain-containing protein n=1 Tax=Pinctada imbricata TaxID=66713 RepID=A0AA89BN29_PINIB|nr:hypothetical protein FSP39_000064 [Pinctada imbricata]